MRFQIYLLLSHRIARFKQVGKNDLLFYFLIEVYNKIFQYDNFKIITVILFVIPPVK